MNKKAYKALEYYKIIDLLTDKASSPMGKDLCRKLTPSTDIEEIRSMQLQTHDALARLFKKGGISFGSVKDIRGTLKRLTVGRSCFPSAVFWKTPAVSKPIPEVTVTTE